MASTKSYKFKIASSLWQWFSTRGNSAPNPWGDIWQCLGVAAGGGSQPAGIWWAEARDAASLPAAHHSLLHTYSAPSAGEAGSGCYTDAAVPGLHIPPFLGGREGLSGGMLVA